MNIYRIRLDRNSPDTGSFEWVSIGENGAVLARGKAPAQTPSPGSSCEVVLASDVVLLHQFEIPLAQRRKLSSVLPYLVEDSVIPEPDRIHAASDVGPSKGVSVGIVDRAWLAEALAFLTRLQLTPTRAYPECLLADLPPSGWTVVFDGASGFARTGRLEGFALDSCDPAHAPMSLRMALSSAQASGTLPHRILISHTRGSPAPDAVRWADQLGVATESGPEWSWSEARGTPTLNVLQGEFATRTHTRRLPRTLRRTVVLAGVLLVMNSAGIAIDWAHKRQEHRELFAEMARVYRETFGEMAVVLDASLQMSRALAELRRGAGYAAPDDLLPMLDVFSAPASAQLGEHGIESLLYENGTLTLSIRTGDATRIRGQIEALRKDLRDRAHGRLALEAAESAGAFTLRVIGAQAAEQ